MNPIRICYHNLKGNAKRRGKEFNLTFEQFKKFAIKSKLLKKRGKTADSYSVDRIRDWEGYTVDNLQVLTLSENTDKENRRRKVQYDYQTKTGSIMEIEPDKPIEEF